MGDCASAVAKEGFAVDTAVTLAAPHCTDHTPRPLFELMRVASSERGGRLHVRRVPLDTWQLKPEALEAFFSHLNGFARNVDSDPAPAKSFACLDRGAAAAEWIKHHVTGLRRCFDDTPE